MKTNRQPAVLPFARDGKFFHKRAVLKADRQSYLDAVGLLRRALEIEPGNPEYMLDLADVFARMSCYDESNQVLVSIVRNGEGTPECFFGMGCNFFALHQYERARDAFLTYRQMEPEGEFSDAVEDMLDELEEIFEEEPPHLSVLARRGGRALDDGDFRLAVQLLARAVEKEPDSLPLRNNLSLAQYCAGDVDAAAREAAHVLSREPDNLHANCNMAIFLSSKGRNGQAAVHLQRAMDAPDKDIEELTKLCLTLCEMHRDGEAREQLKKLLQMHPYDKNALHYYAVSCYNVGEYRDAISAWDTERRIDPYSPVPPYCIAQAGVALEGGPIERMEYHNQLPPKEIQRRVAAFAGDLTGKKREDFKRSFESDEGFRELVRWGMGVPDNAFKITSIRLLIYVGGPIAEEMLREFLMKPDEGEEIKREVMGGLNEMGAKEPYMAVLGGSVVEVRVSVFSSERALSDAQRSAVQMAIEALPLPEDMPREERDVAVNGVIELWARYLGSPGARAQYIRKPENWAAALLYVYMGRKGSPLSESRVCADFGIQKRTLRTYVRYLAQTPWEDGD